MNELEQKYLAHHGILGQKWGQRNGPPYPIGGSDHSVSEKKAGYKKSLNGGHNENLYNRSSQNTPKEKKEFHLTDQQKKYLKIGAKVVGTALVAYGSYKIASNPKFRRMVGKGMDAVMKKPSYDDGPKIINKKTGEVLKDIDIDDLIKKDFVNPGDAVKKLDSVLDGKFKKDLNFTHNIDKDFKTINPNYHNQLGFQLLSSIDKTPIDQVNCSACTTAYELKCRGFSQVKAQLVDTRTMPVDELMSKVYKNPVKEGGKFVTWNGLNKTLSKQGNGARGNLVIPFARGGSHSVAYEIDKTGKLWYIDSQAGGKFGSIKELSDFLVKENGTPYAAIRDDVKVAKWFRTDNLELNDLDTIMKLCVGG